MYSADILQFLSLFRLFKPSVLIIFIRNFEVSAEFVSIRLISFDKRSQVGEFSSEDGDPKSSKVKRMLAILIFRAC